MKVPEFVKTSAMSALLAFAGGVFIGGPLFDQNAPKWVVAIATPAGLFLFWVGSIGFGAGSEEYREWKAGRRS